MSKFRYTGKTVLAACTAAMLWPTAVSAGGVVLSDAWLDTITAGTAQASSLASAQALALGAVTSTTTSAETLAETRPDLARARASAEAYAAGSEGALVSVAGGSDVQVENTRAAIMVTGVSAASGDAEATATLNVKAKAKANHAFAHAKLTQTASGTTTDFLTDVDHMAFGDDVDVKTKTLDVTNAHGTTIKTWIKLKVR